MNSQPIQLQAAFGADGALVITPGGGVPVLLSYSTDQLGNKTAIIAFGGVNQAVVTFDATGRQPMNFMFYNPAPDYQLEGSVRNIIQYIASSPTLH